MEVSDVAVPVFPPGPKSQALLQRLQHAIGSANYTGLYGISLEKGKNYLVQDVDGNIYVDCLSSASSCSLGYGQDFLIKAYSDSAKDIQQTCFTYSPNVHAIELAEKLKTLWPDQSEVRVMLGLSGSDSSGGAIKALRKYTKKPKVIHFKNDYHGSTGLSQQASDYGSLDDGIYSQNDLFIEHSFPTTDAQAAQRLIEIAADLALEDVGGIICEVIQGDAGIVVPPAGFIKGLRELTDATGTLLIVDEVQSGMGRTGKWWAFEHEDIVPDMIVTAKGLSGGYAPISAVIGRKEIIDSLSAGQHIFTFGGHPPSAAVACAVIDYIREKNLPDHAASLGSYLIGELEVIKAVFPQQILQVRGKGLMIGLQINIDASDIAGKVFATRCAEKGLYVGFFGVDADIVRIQPPLILDQKGADFILATIKDVAVEIRDNKVPQKTYENVNKYSIGI
jgi:4-aminobutyrate aminotransferase